MRPRTTGLSRRDWLRHSGLSLLGAGCCRWLPALAAEAARQGPPRRHCVLLWMAGGPSQLDTFDMKPRHANGGEFAEAATKVPGLRFSEHLPQLAQHADQLAVIRGLSTKEGDHGRGTFLMRTGRQPGGALRHPAIGSALSKELGSEQAELPNYVSIGSNNAFNPSAFGPGFLGPKYAAAPVGVVGGGEPPDDSGDQDQGAAAFANLGVDFLRAAPGVDQLQARRRLQLFRSLQDGFLAEHGGAANAVAHDTVYQRAIRMMHSQARDAFVLDAEPDEVRQAYGRGVFGQGCLMARRLIERGVPFVEVTLGNNGASWDSHQDNFNTVRALSQELDAGWGALMTELQERGLLESTTILWMGEFGRTPTINDNSGRDHYPQAWSCVLAGGGIRGGQAYGATSPDGQEVVDGQVDETRVLATLCRALGVDPATENITRLGRPIKIVEGEPIDELLA